MSQIYRITRTLLGLAVIFSLSGCGYDRIPERDEIHTVIKVWKQRPISVQDDVSPQYKAVLENGDTVPARYNTLPGDIFKYVYYPKAK
jgi:hypothetical protein